MATQQHPHNQQRFYSENFIQTQNKNILPPLFNYFRENVKFVFIFVLNLIFVARVTIHINVNIWPKSIKKRQINDESP